MRICLITEGERPLSAGTEGFLRSLGDLSGTERSWILFALTERTAELVSPAGAEAVCTLPLLEAAPPDGRPRLSRRQREALRTLVLGRDIPWKELFSAFRGLQETPTDLVAGPAFLAAAKERAADYPDAPFAACLAALRSLYRPLLKLLTGPIPEAALYQSMGDGFAAVAGAMGKARSGAALLLSLSDEDDARERELRAADWIEPTLRPLWVDFFRMLRACGLAFADQAVFSSPSGRDAAVEAGFPSDRARLLPDAFLCSAALALPLPGEDEAAVVGAELSGDGGAALRAFRAARLRDARLTLRTSGVPPRAEAGVARSEAPDLPSLAGESGLLCLPAGSGRARLLTALAAGRPAVTDDPAAESLLRGSGDTYGPAGIFCESEEMMAEALVYLAAHPDIAGLMGRAGRRRAADLLRACAAAWQDVYAALAPEAATIPAEESEAVTI